MEKAVEPVCPSLIEGIGNLGLLASIYILVYPGSVEWADEHQELVESILPEDVFLFLGEPNGEVLRDFRCGFEGICG